jgi:hypothetical protein
MQWLLPQHLSLSSMLRLFLVSCGLIASTTNALPAQAASESSAPAAARPSVEPLLDALVGDWSMAGQVVGHPATYDLAGRRVLGGKYVELHMTDVTRPPKYEARVFIGADTVAGRILVHWIDNTGAAYSVPPGTGTIAGDTLVFEIPYSTGPFRDTFTFDRRARIWTFRLESGDGKGGWRLFANYTVKTASPAR